MRACAPFVVALSAALRTRERPEATAPASGLGPALASKPASVRDLTSHKRTLPLSPLLSRTAAARGAPEQQCKECAITARCLGGKLQSRTRTQISQPFDNSAVAGGFVAWNAEWGRRAGEREAIRQALQVGASLPAGGDGSARLRSCLFVTNGAPDTCEPFVSSNLPWTSVAKAPW